MQGKIVKGIAGFYYVHVNKEKAANGVIRNDGLIYKEENSDKSVNFNVGMEKYGKIYECKAKGVFRKDKLKPLVGDNCLIEIIDEDKRLGNITEILPRNSELIRPAVANIDQAIIIFSLVKPAPNFNLLDRFLIMMEQQGIPCIIVFNKLDLDEDGLADSYEKIYRGCGYKTITVSTVSNKGLDELKKILKDKTTTVAGPSGVGKSSIVNCMQSGFKMETGDLSEKIERGKNTTRHTELLAIEKDTYILDTPGFSSLDLFNIQKEDLYLYYKEFVPFEKNCRFGGCSHIAESVCGIKDAVLNGEISKMRYENYKLLYEELKNSRKH